MGQSINNDNDDDSDNFCFWFQTTFSFFFNTCTHSQPIAICPWPLCNRRMSQMFLFGYTCDLWSRSHATLARRLYTATHKKAKAISVGTTLSQLQLASGSPFSKHLIQERESWRDEGAEFLLRKRPKTRYPAAFHSTLGRTLVHGCRQPSSGD